MVTGMIGFKLARRLKGELIREGDTIPLQAQNEVWRGVPVISGE